MNPARRRVSLSLTAQEYEQLLSISDYLGIKPTSAAHRALTQGLSIIFNEGQKLKSTLKFAQVNELARIQLLNASNPPDSVKKEPLKNDPLIKGARKALERLSVHDRKILEKSFGSLTNAARLGVRASGRDFSVPDEIKHRVKLPANRVV